MDAKVKETVTLLAADNGDRLIWCRVTSFGVMGEKFLTGNGDYVKV
jgi:hypothetical protein